ncbi:MAG: hypothetical protein QME66_12100 [Candidatus Eisenbacteria bacterium]|nr:hypothetical protein [Candidatus Eisenbacteria bacterium]
MKKYFLPVLGGALLIGALLASCSKKDPIDVILSNTTLQEEAIERMVADTATMDKLIDKLFAHPLAIDKLSEKVVADTTVAGEFVEKMARDPDTLAKMMAAVEAAKKNPPTYMK